MSGALPRVERQRSTRDAILELGMRSRSELGFVAVFALVFAPVLGASSRGHAFERSTVDDDPTTPLWWRFRTVIVRPVYDSSDDLGDAEVRSAIERSLATWNAAAAGCSDFRLVDGGYPTGLATNLEDGRHDGENRIRWRETEWPDEMETLALTTSVYRRSTGQILDTDIDLNGVHHEWSATDDPAAVRTDVENTLTHELGHLLGLAHVLDPEATMFGESYPGDLAKRSLTEDDVNGLCYVYPSGERSPGAPLLESDPLTSGCSLAATRSVIPRWWLLVALGLAARLASTSRRARRRVRRRRTPGDRRGAHRDGTACASTRAAGRRGAPSPARRRSRPRG